MTENSGKKLSASDLAQLAGTDGNQKPSVPPAPRPHKSPFGQIGSAYAANRAISGVEEEKTPSTLSPQSVEGLMALQKKQKEDKERVEEEAKQREEAVLRQQEDFAEQERQRMLELGVLNAVQAALLDNPWLGEGVRERQEAAIDALMNGDNRLTLTGILRDRGKQLVPIADDYFVSFQVIATGEEMLIKHILREAREQLEDYFRLYQDLLRLAVSVEEYGGVVAPPLLDEKTNRATEATLKARLNALLMLPLPLVSAIAVNYSWYDLRVKRLMMPSSLKNG